MPAFVEPLSDLVSVHRAPRERAEDEQVECATEDGQGSRHAVSLQVLSTDTVWTLSNLKRLATIVKPNVVKRRGLLCGGVQLPAQDGGASLAAEYTDGTETSHGNRSAAT